MSVFSALKTPNATITVARRTGQTVDGDPEYGAQKTIRARVREQSFRDQKNGRMTDVFTKITTDEWVFQKTDAVWLPGTDPNEIGDAQSPRIVISSGVGRYYLSGAEF